MRSSPLKSRGQSHPYSITPTGSKTLPKNHIRKPSPTKLEKFNTRLSKSPYQSVYSILSGEKSPTKFSPVRVDTGESQDSKEIQRLNEKLSSCQKELQLTKTNFIDSQNKLEKIIKDQKYCINELEIENLKVTKELSTIKNTCKKEYENLQEKDNKMIGDLQKKNKEFEEQSKFYIQENIKLKQNYEKEIFNLKTLIKDHELKLEMYKREFSSFHTKAKKEQDETGFKEEYIKKLQEGIKEKSKQTSELKQSIDHYFKQLEEKEQKILSLEKEIKKEKDINRMLSEKISDLMQDRINTQSETRRKTRKTEINDKRSPNRQKSPVFIPAPETRARDFELSLETSLKNSRLSDIQSREESILKLKTHITGLEHKLNELSEDNSKLRRENAKFIDKQILPDEDTGRYRNLRQSPPRGLFMNLFKNDEDEKKMINKIDELSEKLEKANKKVNELQSKNEDLDLKLVDMKNDNERIQYNYENLLVEIEGNKNIIRERAKEKDKEKSDFINELKNKVSERNKMIESLQELLRKERQNFERKWLEQEENHANEMQVIISSPYRKQQYSEEYNTEFSNESNKNIDELKGKIKELHGIINQMEKKSLEKDKENVQILLKKSNEINELSVEKKNLNKIILDLRGKIDEVKGENVELNRKNIENEESVPGLVNENKGFARDMENIPNAQTLEAELQNKENIIKKLQFNIKSLENTIKSYQETVHNKNNLLEQSNFTRLEIEKNFQNKIQELDDMKEVKLIKDDLLEQSNYIKLELENDFQKTVNELNDIKYNKAKEEENKKYEIERKELEISTLKNQVFLLESRLKDITEENVKKNKPDEEKCSIKTTQNLLEEQLKSANDEILSLKDKLNQKVSELEIIKISLENSKNQLGQVTEELNLKLLQSKQEFYALKDTQTKLESEAKSQEAKLKLSEMHKNQLQKTIKDLENDIKSLKDDNYHLVKQLEENESQENLKEPEIIINFGSESSIFDRKQSENELREHISNLEDKLRLLQNQDKDKEVHTEQIPQDTMEKLSIFIDNQKDLTQAIQALEDQNIKICQMLNEKTQEVKEISVKKCEFMNRIEELSEENKKLHEENMSIVTSNNEHQIKIENFNKKIMNLETQIQELKEKNIRLEKSLENQDNIIKQKEKNYKQVMLEKMVMDKKIEEFNKEILMIKDENIELIKEKEDLEEINEQMDNEIKEMGKILDEMSKESLIKQHLFSKDVVDEMENKWKKNENQLKEQIEDKNIQIKNLENVIKEKNLNVLKDMEISEKDKEINECKETCERKILEVRQEMLVVKENIKKIEKDFKEKEAQVKIADARKMKMMENIKELEDDLKILREENYRLLVKGSQVSTDNAFFADSQEMNLIVESKIQEEIELMKSKEQQFIRKISDLEDELRFMKEENDKVKVLVDDYQSQIKEKSTIIKRLQESLFKEQEQTRQIKRNQDTYTKELLIIKEDNINLIKEKEHLEDENENLNKILETLSESQTQPQKFTQIEFLQSELTQKTGEIQSLNTQLHNLTSEIGIKNSELEKMRIEKFSIIQDLTQKCSKLESEIKNKDNKLKLIELHKGQIQKDLKNYEIELQVLREDNYVLVKKCELLEQNSEDPRDKTENIEKFIENEKKMIGQIENLQREYKESQEFIRKMNKEKDEFSSKLKELEDCRLNISRLDQEKESFLRNIKELSQNVEFLRKTNQADKEKYEKEANKQRKDLEMLKKQTKSRLDEDNVEKLHLKETNIQLISQNEKLEENIESLNQKQEDYLIQISNFQNQIINIKNLLKEKSLALDILKDQQTKHLHQISNLEAQNKNLINQIQENPNKNPEISETNLLL
ncbi:hypothetical protein SteCoe_6615 [Stentor coeruleus]|uniref:Uncharacterized protein n=1 Tax=Stentor coeruleus TaxID=5963 RepID=A0A1R2CPL2_9CILI|nr:hypothetical protein SteCoe_6615 [Stentor coeruleus]